ncbi:MAG: hypothetical protein LRY68_08080 [Sulfurospirillum sp.]|nr:hypothetical protein [Sulfurospirillum sp.]
MTYVGYALLFLGLIFNLFDKTSRFSKLLASMKQTSLLVGLILLTQTPLFFAQ